MIGGVLGWTGQGVVVVPLSASLFIPSLSVGRIPQISCAFSLVSLL